MHEVVYIAFLDPSNLTNPKPGCYVVRFHSRDAGGRHWMRRDLLLKKAVYPEERTRDSTGGIDLSGGHRTLEYAGQDGFVAFNCYVDDTYGILLVSPDNQSRYLPLEEPSGTYPSGTYLWSMNFADDSKTLVLSYANRTPPMPPHHGVYRTPPIRPAWVYGHITRFLRWDSGSLTVDTVPGWCAYAGAREAFLVDAAGTPFTYDILARRRGSNPHAEARLMRLLVKRNSPAILRNRMSGKDLPTVVYGSEKTYTLSSDLIFMFDMEAIEMGPPLGGDPKWDWSDDFVRDWLYTADRGVLWTIIRGSHAPHSGFQFLNDQGDFRFLSPGPLRMRPDDGPVHTFPSYAPGIFEVELARRRVHYISPPGAAKGALAGSPMRGDVFGRAIAGNAVFLMKRGSARNRA